MSEGTEQRRAARAEWAEELTLLGVGRPARYAGLVERPPSPSPEEAAITLLLASPDLYEDALGDPALHAAARRLARSRDVSWDLAFAPWMDMEKEMAAGRRPLGGIYTRRPLAEFDLVLISGRDELQAPTVLNLAALGGVAPLARERTGEAPIILIADRLAWNPEPLAAIGDAFLIGDVEAVLGGILAEAARPEFRRRDRAERIASLGSLPGVYVPALHPGAGALPPIAAVRTASLDEASAGATPLVPLAEVTRERLGVEIQRGCGGSCRSCRELRPRSQPLLRGVASVEEEVMAGLARGGWDEVRLVAPPGVGGAYLASMVGALRPAVQGRRVAFGLPPLRPADVTRALLDAIAAERRTRITLAPELTGRVEEWDTLFEALDQLCRAGWKAADLEVSLGPPDDEERQRSLLLAVFRRLASAGRRADGGRLALAIALRPFTARAHTAYQWDGADGLDELNEALAFYRARLQAPRVRLRWEEPGMTLVRGRLARGGREMGAVILSAWRRGARLEQNRELFDLARWSSAFDEAGIHLAGELRPLDPASTLPWSHIRAGRPEAELARLRENLAECAIPADCQLRAVPESPGSAAPPESTPRDMAASASAAAATPASATRARLPRRPAPAAGPSRVRVAYAIRGDLRLLSHLDVVRLFDRLLRRAAIPVEYSQGAVAHPRISFGLPRAVGMASLGEFLDIACSAPFTEERQRAFREVMPPGMTIVRIMPLYGPRASLEAAVNCGAYRVTLAVAGEPTPLLASHGAWEPSGAGAPAWLMERAAAFEGSRETKIRRVTPKKVQEVDLRASLLDHDWESGEGGFLALNLLVAHGGRGRARPSEVAAALLGLAPGEAGLLRIERTGLYWREPSGSLRDPFGERRDAPWAIASSSRSETPRGN